MSTLFSINGKLVPTGEIEYLSSTGAMSRFLTALENGHDASLDLQAGRAATGNVLTSRTTTAGDIVPWQPVGLGKPLTIEIRTVYMGKYPEPWGTKDLLITSAIKSVETYGAAPRAIQAVASRVSRFRPFEFHAASPGTSIVYYSPGIVDNSTLVQLDMVIDAFPQAAVNQVGTLLSAAAGLPVFAPASMYLMAGSMFVKTLAPLLESLIDGKPFLSDTERINFDAPGYANMVEGFVVLSEQKDEAQLVNNCEIDGNGVLINKTDKSRYQGDIPYIVLSLDGSKRDNLASFKPTLATAAILDRFYRTESSGTTAATALTEGLKYYSDFTFREKALRQKTKVESLPAGSDQRAKEQALLDAYIANILTDELKPKP